MVLKSINPHDQSIVGETKISTKSETENVITLAKKAFSKWRKLSVKERIEFIKKYKEAIIKNKGKIAKLTSTEMGKPLTQAFDDVIFEAKFLDYYIENGEKFLEEEIIHKEKGKIFKTIFEPYGVCACISPWNFPLSMMNSGVIPALIAGNTVVFKPSEYTTLTQKFCFELLQKTGLPENIANIVIGAGEVGKILIDSPVDLVWFTGSTKVGQEIYAKCGQKFIKCLAEMGGSSAGIIFTDANLENAVEQIYWARFLNAGQVCSAVKRLFVERSIAKKFLKKLVQRVGTAKIGNPVENVDIGPLVSAKQLEKLEKQVKDALLKGAKIETGGKRPGDPKLKDGNYFEPTILTNVKQDMVVLTEETFGPVLPIVQFETIKEVVELVNSIEYGLTNEIYTSDLKKAEDLAKDLQSGTVAINTDSYFEPYFPFGGRKKSGVGREYGRVGMQEFCQLKSIVISK